jgi:hypothetical protein
LIRRAVQRWSDSVVVQDVIEADGAVP